LFFKDKSIPNWQSNGTIYQITSMAYKPALARINAKLRLTEDTIELIRVQIASRPTKYVIEPYLTVKKVLMQSGELLSVLESEEQSPLFLTKRGKKEEGNYYEDFW
jgi:hypothetical protein